MHGAITYMIAISATNAKLRFELIFLRKNY